MKISEEIKDRLLSGPTYLGYTLTDCYSGNADYGKTQQKQYVLIIGNSEELFNVLIGGYVNGPADSDRRRTISIRIKLEESQIKDLIELSESYKYIDWNHVPYFSIPPNTLSPEQLKEISDANSAYVEKLHGICETWNIGEQQRVALFIENFIRTYLPSEPKDEIKKHIYIF